MEVLFPKHPEGQAIPQIVLQEIFQQHVTWVRVLEFKVSGLLRFENWLIEFLQDITPVRNPSSHPESIPPIEKYYYKVDKLVIQYFDGTLDVELNGVNVKNAKINGLTVPGVMGGEKNSKRVNGYWRSEALGHVREHRSFDFASY